MDIGHFSLVNGHFSLVIGHFLIGYRTLKKMINIQFSMTNF